MSNFETFIKDKSNNFAFAACQTILEHPSEYCNPLWLYGPPACGKSHLLNAICNKLETDRTRVALCLTAEGLVEAMISNFISENKVWLKIKNADMLMIDNIEYLKGKQTTQEELALLTLRKQADKQQVIFASNCRPAELPVLNRVLFKQTGTGLIAGIQPPSCELKRRYAEKFIENNPFQITKEALELLISELISISQLNRALQASHSNSSADNSKIDTIWVFHHINKFKEW